MHIVHITPSSIIVSQELSDEAHFTAVLPPEYAMKRVVPHVRRISNKTLAVLLAFPKRSN